VTKRGPFRDARLPLLARPIPFAPPSCFLPVPVTGLTSGATAISVGLSSACAVTARGGVECWGDGGPGELGNGSAAKSSRPVPVTGFTSGATGVSVGALLSACAVGPGGRVQCWGRNHDLYGGLPLTQSMVPVPVTGLSSGMIATSVGSESACVLTAQGGVECWGFNGGGLGNSSTIDSSVPVSVYGSVGSRDRGFRGVPLRLCGPCRWWRRVLGR